MSTVTPAPTAAPPTVATGADRARAAIVATLLTLGAVAVAAVVLWQPWGGRDRFGYADLAPHRDAAWLGSLIDGLAFAAVGVALGLAVCRLAAGRGAVLATIGAFLTGVGGVTFCAGIVSFGSFAWYATSTEAIPAEAGTALMAYLQDNPGRLMGPQLAGFLLFTIGSLVLMAALWRARSVPRWLPVAYLVLTIGVFATGGVVLNVVEAAQMLSLAIVAFYTLRTPVGR